MQWVSEHLMSASWTYTYLLLHFQIELLYPDVGHVEIDPDKLWASVIKVVKEAIAGNC